MTEAAGEGVVAIQFSEKDREILSDFNALVESGQKGSRALILTQKVCPHRQI